MKRTKQVATGSSNFYQAGINDPILRRMLGNDALQYLANGNRPPKPMSNVEAARAYFLKQQAAKRSK